MKLDSAARLNADSAGGQTGGSSMIGRTYWVKDTKYGQIISGPYNNPDDAEKAARARPYSKIVSKPNEDVLPVVRDNARKRLVRTNPDVD